MSYPDLLILPSIEDYRKYYEDNYCRVPIITFDNIPVYFSKNRFTHAFFESSKKDKIKDTFSIKRAQRINWIKTTLQDKNALLFVGWDNKKKCYDYYRRVVVVLGNYVVIIRFNKFKNAAFFVTAYVADHKRTLSMIMKSPIWK